MLAMGTLLSALLSSTSISLLLFILSSKNGRLLLRDGTNGNGSGRNVRAILWGSLFSGLASLPYLIFVLHFQSRICPHWPLRLLASIRVFTMRFELAQLLVLSIDRFICSTFEANTSINRFFYRRLFWPIQSVCLLLAFADWLAFILPLRDMPAYSMDCTIFSVSSPWYLHWHFFLFNFLTFALALAFRLSTLKCFRTNLPEKPVQQQQGGGREGNFGDGVPNYQHHHHHQSNRKRRIARVSGKMFTAFCLVLAVLIAGQLMKRFLLIDGLEDLNKSLANIADLLLQLLHLTYLPIVIVSAIVGKHSDIKVVQSKHNTTSRDRDSTA